MEDAEQKMQAVVADGKAGNIGYKVEFKAMQLQVSVSDDALGISNVTSVGAELVLAAIFAKLPKGTVAEGVEGLILAGLRAVN